MPVHYIYRALSEPELVALYRAADVMLVTPLRDGMNLVAKEFVASRTDGDGVLVLSEFAGASWELPEAIQVNPYDVDGMAESTYRALTMDPEERRARLAPLRLRVETYDVHRWAATFLEQLDTITRRLPLTAAVPGGPAAARQALHTRLRESEDLLLLLDYDGTLVPYTPTPELARPDAALRELLEELARRPRTEIHVVSGRGREP
ncbi:MAG: trehalose 6-phosphatase / trehalose 6-phosphate synthase, partial [Geminicoccaceae bacterium]|nr:trehalose 6-phosphatase / trehalose 6-phosphate synthase [Geminicoccaceae bacterium]